MTPAPACRLDDCLDGQGDGVRVLVVVAHPDDEVLGCGVLLTRLGDVRVIHVTDGAPGDGADARRHGFASPADYAAARTGEARFALALAGVSPDRLACLGLPDQGVSLGLAEVARRLAPVLARSDLVLTHAFEGGHSDHDAVAFAVHAGTRLLAPAARPALAEMPFYHADHQGWRRQAFLPQPGAGPERVVALDAGAQALKAGMLAAHASQGDTLRVFALEAERFRAAPHYDFALRPHAGDLLYERHGWNLDWPGWVARVHAAEAELGQEHAA